MSGRPLVSVITPTWQRHALLAEAIENVRQQTYRPLEHVVVSDGQDGDLVRWIVATRYNRPCPVDPADDVSLRFVELGQHWTGILRDSYAAAPLTVGMFLARGAYQMWLADDERITPDHCAALVELLEARGADLAYSKAELWWRDDPGRRLVIGTEPPHCGQITNVLYRAELLRHSLYVFGNDRTADWETIARWLAAGARYAFLDRVTVTHRVDR
jgi:glycosyltransferase involved in cell wall biosynthesis